jgi:hypothetical protein
MLGTTIVMPLNLHWVVCLYLASYIAQQKIMNVTCDGMQLMTVVIS